jgi:lipopolysaccharide assembly outer membrane protein LptD (OstA)
VGGQAITNPKNIIPNISKRDTIRADSLIKTVPDTLKKNNDLQTSVVYSATDSTIMDTQNQVVYLYGDAKVTYGDVVLQADFIKLNWDKNEVFAKGTKDTVTNKTIGKPVFKQGGEPYDADEIKYNFKSRKAIIKGLVTKQGDAYVQGTSVKKDNEDNLYIRNAIYTTCNLAHPHYSIRASKIKMVGKKEIVAGPFHFELNEIPLPIGLPFGFFPYKPPQENGTSGIVFPQYGDEQARGFFLREGGYYFAISENIGLKLTADLYTKGSYNFRAQSEYVKRYRYSGRFDINFGKNDFVGNELLFDKNSTNNFGIIWSHTPQSRGNSSFSASVNINSNSNNQFNRSTSSSAYISTALNSSIQYSRNFGQTIRTSLSTNVDQNTSTKAININNNFSFGLNQFQPLKKKNAVAERFWDGFRLGLDFNGTYNFTNKAAQTEREYDSYPFVVYRKRDTLDLNKTIPLVTDPTKQLSNLENYVRNGIDSTGLAGILKSGKLTMQYSIPLSLPNIKLGKYINITPGMSLSGNVYTNQYNYTFKNYNDKAPKSKNDSIANIGAVRIDTVTGFIPDYKLSFSASANTRLYGTINFRKGRVQGIRHIISPSVGFSYTPDASANQSYYQTTQINNRVHKITATEREFIKFPSDEENGQYISSDYKYINNKNNANNEVNSITIVGKDTLLAGDFLNVSRFDPRQSGFGSRSGGISFGISNTLEMKLKSKSDTAAKESEKITLIDNFSLNSNYNFFAKEFKLSNINFSANSRVKKFDINIGGTLDPYRYINDGYSLSGRRINVFRASKDEQGNTDGLVQLANFNFSIGKSFSPNSTNKKKQLPQNSNLPNNDFQQTQIDHVNRNINDYVDWSVPWQFQFSYQYNYIKTGYAPAVVVSAVTFSGSLKLTEKWDFKLQSGFDFTVNRPSLTNIQVSRNLHCWQASFTWTPIASQYYGRGGTYEFNIGVTSELLKELKISRRRNAIF